jgi:L-alanine-DL-glutamate epimerase-like enolase superfamily enzyme
MTDRIVSVETFIVTVPRNVPYLGPLGPGESPNSRGYIVRAGNGTIYPMVDRSVVVRVTTGDGRIGWGETYGLCAPRATCEIINDLLAPVLVGETFSDPETQWDRLYGLTRVRGCSGGCHGDALAALDIALWDLKGQAAGMSIRDLIGPTVHTTIPGYASGLPAATLKERVALAVAMQQRGHDAFKFAAVVSSEGIVEEMAALREALGPAADILIDLHWKFEPEQAVRLAEALAPYQPGFLEAPVSPEDIAGLAQVADASPIPIAGGEEWYTEHDAKNRLAVASVAFVQPEMGHTGITQFLRISRIAAAKKARIAPHATVGTGIFLAASLQASATVSQLWKHEWQHSIFGRNLALLEGEMDYAEGSYVLPQGPGIGVRPGDSFWNHAELVR